MLHSIEVAVFHFINGTLSNRLFDTLMPLLSGNSFFAPGLFLLAIALIWKGGKRGRLCLFFVVLAVAVGDGWICNTIKEAVARPRPFYEFPEANLLVGRGKAYSMPSAHAANWFAATMIFVIFYKRSWRFMLPLSLLVSFSRIYNGVHYPSDVLAGAVLGAGYAAAFVWLGNAAWQFIGPRWFPIWWEKTPSLIDPTRQVDVSTFDPRPSILDQHWLRLGYIFILALLAFRLFYVGSGKIELSEDEAYQWVWSKHLALSYYSKPPFIAYIQFLATHLWGDTPFGVRFFSPVIAALLSFLLLQFFARINHVRAGLLLIASLAATPLTAAGSLLMTIDPLSVLFWTAAMVAGWRAVQDEGTTRDWLWTGLWMGCGFLSKYTNLFQLLCWLVLFLFWPKARKHLRKPGPYLALALVLFSLTPVLIWNAQHQWITLQHVADNGGLQKHWEPTLRYTLDFLGSEFFLLNPFFFLMVVWASIVCWRTGKKDPMQIYFFSMGAPVFLFYFALSFKSRILPNWIAPAIVPLFSLMALQITTRWKTSRNLLQPCLIGGFCLGFSIVALLHETDLTKKIFHRTLPAQIDPLRRVRGWKDTVKATEAARQQLAEEGPDTFIIGDHYGITGLLSFYLPAARNSVRHDPLVFYRASSHPKNQFYFWPGYEGRIGDNAIYVQQLDLPKLPPDWATEWLLKNKIPNTPLAIRSSPPAEILRQFDSVTSVGVKEIFYGKRVFRRVQLFECRGLSPPPSQ